VRLGLAGVIAAASLTLYAQTGYRELYNQAEQAEKDGRHTHAYLLYSQAAAQNPKDGRAWAKAQNLRRRALLETETAALTAATPSTAAAKPSPDVPLLPTPTEDDEKSARQPLPPIRLQIPDAQRSRPHDFDIRGDGRRLWEEAARSYGFSVVFDGDYQPLANLRLQLTGTTFEEAVQVLEHATNSFLVPISGKMAMVARDTQQKRQELEHHLAISVAIPEPVTVQEAQELARGVQQLMELQKFSFDSNRRVAILRGPAAKVLPAVAIFRQMLIPKPDVYLEVEFYELASTYDSSVGFTVPTQFPIVWLSKIWNSTPAFPAGFTNFLTFGGGKTFFGIGVSALEAVATFSQASGKSLLKSEIRSSSGLPATLHIGDRYPVVTNQYIGDTSGQGTVYAPPPSFNFEDLGVVLKVTPLVHDRDEISLAVEADFKVLTGETLNGIPVIASRKFQTGCRLNEGEVAVIAGLMRSTEARSVSGLWGLGNIPILGHLFRQTTKSKNEGQVLLVIRPRLLGPSPAESLTALGAFATGSEGRPRIPF